MELFTRKTPQLRPAIHDTLMCAASFLLALYLRYGNIIETFASPLLALYTALCMIICLAVFRKVGLYRGLWRYASLPDLVTIVQAVSVALLVFYLLLFSINRLADIPRSTPFIQWLLLVILLGGPRFAYRSWRNWKLGLEQGFTLQDRIPVLLIGASDRAELFLRDTRAGASSQYLVVGIVDDDPGKQNRSIHNIRIYGTLSDLPRVIEKLARADIRPQKAILTLDAMDGARVRELLAVTEKLGLPLARLPRLSEFKHGVKEKADIQPIAVEDLLGRAQNVHDKTPVKNFLNAKTVLITGAGGSIGSELARQVANFSPKLLLLFELSEFALYQIDMELGSLYPDIPRIALLGDVRNASQLENLFARHQPQVVLHAAAIKHVPLAEANPEEAILTNLQGTQALAEASAKAGVQVMLMISTDKAVNPTSVMGASKRAAESFCQALAHSPTGKNTRFVAVRFGNVLGSTGSVVPLFQQQLAAGGPLTVTHKDMVRYFMTIREAVELVLQAATLSNASGEVYVLDMGQPVKILDLAEQMIRLAGLKPYEDIKIEFTGLRPGEKMFEELFLSSESHVKTQHESIWLARLPHLPMKELTPLMQELLKACQLRQTDKAVQALKRIVPEFNNTNQSFAKVS